MRSIFNPIERDALVRRIGSLRADEPHHWGRMNALEMVSHLNRALRASLGELAVGPPQGTYSRSPLNWLAIHVFPWPHGMLQSPPEFLGPPSENWDAALTALQDLVTRCAARGPDAPWPPSRAFGDISGRTWGVLHRKHLDHHLRQFGA